MEIDLYLWFILVSLAVLIFPGPSILLIVANSLQRGMIIGLYTVAGGFFAMGVQLLIALAGVQSAAENLGGEFAWIRWAGVAYLVYLGAQRWRGHAYSEVRGRHSSDRGSAVVQGFIVALTNPGTMLFFVAFFPQFLNLEVPAGPQLLQMATTFMVLTTLVDVGYAVLAARVAERLHEPGRATARNRLAGLILLLAAVTLALINV